jgi:hypothetical protein
LAASSPPAGQELLAGEPLKFGSSADPAVGKRPGGTVLFGGGLALYRGKQVVGGLAMSGDTSCADHNIAWRVRQKLGLDKVPDGPSPAHNDEIVYDVGSNGKSVSGGAIPSAATARLRWPCRSARASPTQRSRCNLEPRKPLSHSRARRRCRTSSRDFDGRVDQSFATWFAPLRFCPCSNGDKRESATPPLMSWRRPARFPKSRERITSTTYPAFIGGCAHSRDCAQHEG